MFFLSFSFTMMRWLSVATFHFAFESHGSLFVSAHSGSPHHHGNRISQDFLFLKKKVHTNYFARWCRRKNSCVKEIWLGGSSSTLQLFMTTLVFSPIGSLWDFELWIEGSLVCFCLRCSLLFLWRGSTCSKFCSQDRKPPRQEKWLNFC